MSARHRRAKASMRPAGTVQELTYATQRMHAESGGLLMVDIVRPIDFLNLLDAASAGDADAFRLVRAAGDAIAGFASMPRSQPALCACCPRPLVSGRYAVAVAVGSVPTPERGLALGICTQCATEPEELLAKAREGLARLWPDLRRVEITHPGGGRA